MIHKTDSLKAHITYIYTGVLFEDLLTKQILQKRMGCVVMIMIAHVLLYTKGVKKSNQRQLVMVVL